MTAIVDASVAIKWVVEEDGSREAAALAGQELRAPDLMLTECANALWAKARRGELTSEEVVERASALQAVPVDLVSQVELLGKAVELALRISHPVYDCLYLALALRDGVAVVTADRRFLTAVRRHDDLATAVIPLHERIDLGG